KRPVTQWGQAAGAQVTVVGWHTMTNLAPSDVRCDLTVENAHTRWGDAGQAQVRANGAWPGSMDEIVQTNLAWPERLSRIPFAASALFSNSRVKGVDSETFSVTVESRASRLNLASSGDLSGGKFS